MVSVKYCTSLFTAPLYQSVHSILCVCVFSIYIYAGHFVDNGSSEVNCGSNAVHSANKLIQT